MARVPVVKIALLIVTLFMVGIWVAHQRVLAAAAGWLNVATAPQQTDYIFVLNGDPNVRPFIAASLVNAGFASKVLLVPMKGPPRHKSKVPASSDTVARKVLIHQGVDSDMIQFIDGQCTSTFDEAELLLKHMTQLGDDTATISIVTSDFHTRRTRWIYRQLFGDQSDRLHFVAAPTDGFDQSNWWRVEDGWVTYVTEFLKFGFYLFRYGNRLWIGGIGLLALATIIFLLYRRQPSAKVEPAHD